MNRSLIWKREMLSNGLAVLLYPRSSALTVQLSVAIKYGSNDDCEDRIGTAHFLEHMIVGGSQKRIKLHHEIEYLGGVSNFETSNECTFSTVNVFPERLHSASKVLSGLLFDTEFEKSKLEHERKVILNEIDEAADDPCDQTQEALLKCLFRKHPAKNPILGTKKTTSQITLRDVEKAHEKYYSPRNMILILTGKFSDNDVKTVLEDFQDREPLGPISRRKRKIENCKPRKEVLMKRAGISQAILSFGLRTPPAKDPDIPAIELSNAILGTGESSRLFVELREKRPLTYDYDSVNIAGLDFGYFTINCAVKTNSLPQTRTIILEELEKLKRQPVTKDELAKGKNQLLNEVFRSVDNHFTFSRILTDLEMEFEDEKALLQYADRIKILIEEDITEIANRYFQEDNYASAITIPKTSRKQKTATRKVI